MQLSFSNLLENKFYSFFINFFLHASFQLFKIEHHPLHRRQYPTMIHHFHNCIPRFLFEIVRELFLVIFL